MGKHVLKQCLALCSLLTVLLTSTGCHLLSSYSEEEIRSYISENFDNMTYTLQRNWDLNWTVTPTDQKDSAFTIRERFHTSAGVVPQVDRILVNDIPEKTALPLLTKYLTKEESAFVSIPEQTQIIKIEIPIRILKDQDVSYFLKRMSDFTAAYNQSYPYFSDQILMRVHIIPEYGDSSLPDDDRQQLSTNINTVQKSLLPKQAPTLYSLQAATDTKNKLNYYELYAFPQKKADFEKLPSLYKAVAAEMNKNIHNGKISAPVGFHGQYILSKYK